MKRIIAIFSAIILSNISLSQKWGIETSMYIQPVKKSIDNSFEGASLQLSYKKPMNEKIELRAGIEFQSNSWSNHVLLSLGGSYTFFNKNNWSSELQINVGNGIALFSPRFLYSFNSKGQLFWNYQTRKENLWGIGFGVHFFSTPPYKRYSDVFNTFNFPISFKYCF
jgi:hypothetical protein